MTSNRALVPVCCFALFAAVSPAIHAASGTGEPVTSESLPTDSGVLVEAHAVIDAPPDAVARAAANPANFFVLLPAERVDVVSDDGNEKMVSVRMRDPLVGAIDWVESVVLRSEAGDFFVERAAVSSPFYKRMSATFRIAPLDEGKRARVTYRVSLDLKRIPGWLVRRGAVSGVRGTVERLRAMVQAH